MNYIYEIIGWPNTCPSERESFGVYSTLSGAELALAKLESEHPNLSFEIESKTIRG